MKEDEALSNRIACLNLLDLTLDHLGLELNARNLGPDVWGDERVEVVEGLEDLVEACRRGTPSAFSVCMVVLMVCGRTRTLAEPIVLFTSVQVARAGKIAQDHR